MATTKKTAPAASPVVARLKVPVLNVEVHMDALQAMCRVAGLSGMPAAAVGELREGLGNLRTTVLETISDTPKAGREALLEILDQVEGLQSALKTKGAR